MRFRGGLDGVDKERHEHDGCGTRRQRRNKRLLCKEADAGRIAKVDDDARCVGA